MEYYHRIFFLLLLLNGAVIMMIGASSSNFLKDITLNIINGSVIENFQDYSYVVHLRDILSQPSHCGAVLITPTMVLTAAHCARENSVNYVIAGLELNSPIMLLEEDDYVFQVRDTVVHPFYNDFTLEYDFCILHLRRPVPSSVARPIPALVSDDTDGGIQNITGTVIGWGATLPDGTLPSVKAQKVDMRIESNEACNDIISNDPQLNPSAILLPTMACALPLSSGTFCFGDSGGPMVLNKEEALVGIVSWVLYCGVKDIPYGLSRVGAARDFITQQLAGETEIIKWVLRIDSSVEEDRGEEAGTIIIENGNSEESDPSEVPEENGSGSNSSEEDSFVIEEEEVDIPENGGSSSSTDDDQDNNTTTIVQDGINTEDESTATTTISNAESNTKSGSFSVLFTMCQVLVLIIPMLH